MATQAANRVYLELQSLMADGAGEPAQIFCRE
jgi:hypothetical protein